MDLVWLKAPQWEGRDGFIHGFLGRRGGKSLGVYASLNLSFRVGDDPQLVKHNLCDVKRVIGLHDLRIVTMRQTHGDHIIDVKDKNLKEAGEADGMVTKERGLFLGVLTADCLPIFFSVLSRRVTAVVHTGWRGSLAGLALKMVKHLKDRYDVNPSSLEVTLGPTIGPCCYEIRTDVSAPLLARWGSLTEKCLQARDDKKFLALRKLNTLILQQAGVPPAQIFRVGPCTACAPDAFYSYRRDRYAAAQEGKEDTGRQLSFAGWL
ncbi:MAG: peptidoglycan editing factor PgeF [Candidatus Binatia bacterium]